MWATSPTVGRRCVVVLTALAVLAGVGGCTLLQQGWLALNGKTDDASLADATSLAPSAPGEHSALKPLAASRSAVVVEVVFVERPADDPLMGDLLWRDLDEVGPLDLPIREGLKKNGFRIGISASSPPRPLQSLLGLSTEVATGAAGDDAKRLVGRRIALTTGSETELQTSPVFNECTVAAWNGEATETTTFTNARCLFRLRALRVKDGWVKLEFTPEIHAGESRVRQVATETGWSLKTTQQVSKFASQRFDLELMQGEMAVVSVHDQVSAATPTDDRAGASITPNPAMCLGRHFFLGNEEGDKVRRVLIVRVADLGRADGVPQR